MGTLANIKVQPCTVAWNSVDLGFTEGDLEIGSSFFQPNTVDITAHQEGSNILDQIVTGRGVPEITVTLKEVTATQIANLLGAALGTSNTPALGTQVVGVGDANQFEGIKQFAQKLVLHPVVNTASDYSEDWAFWKAVPVLDSITKSGENPETCSVTFRLFKDDAKISGLEYGVYGDHTQTLTA